LPEAATMPVPLSRPQLKEPEGLQDLARPLGRGNQRNPDGKPIFGIDVTLPGMLYAVFEKTPVLVQGGQREPGRGQGAQRVKHAFVVEGIPSPTLPNYLFEGPGFEGEWRLSPTVVGGAVRKTKARGEVDFGKWGAQDSDANARKR